MHAAGFMGILQGTIVRILQVGGGATWTDGLVEACVQSFSGASGLAWAADPEGNSLQRCEKQGDSP